MAYADNVSGLLLRGWASKVAIRALGFLGFLPAGMLFSMEQVVTKSGMQNNGMGMATFLSYLGLALLKVG